MMTTGEALFGLVWVFGIVPLVMLASIVGPAWIASQELRNAGSGKISALLVAVIVCAAMMFAGRWLQGFWRSYELLAAHTVAGLVLLWWLIRRRKLRTARQWSKLKEIQDKAWREVEKEVKEGRGSS